MLKPKLAQIVHFLYDKEILTEESILMWHDALEDDKEWVKSAVSKLVAWLEESSDDDDDSSEDED